MIPVATTNSYLSPGQIWCKILFMWETIFKQLLGRGHHKKYLVPQHSPFGVPLMPSDKPISAKQVLPERKAPCCQVINLISLTQHEYQVNKVFKRKFQNSESITLSVCCIKGCLFDGWFYGISILIGLFKAKFWFAWGFLQAVIWFQVTNV